MNAVPYCMLPAWQRLERDREEIYDLLNEAERIQAMPDEELATLPYDSREEAVEYLSGEAQRLQAILEEKEEEYRISLVTDYEPY